MSVTADRTEAPGGETFETVAPATGEVIATLPVHGEAEVREAVQRARKASQWWSGLESPERRIAMGTAARQRVLDEYSCQRIAPLQEAFYQRAMAAGHVAGSRNGKPLARIGDPQPSINFGVDFL